MKVAVFYGGKSCERDISIITALQAMGCMTAHEILPVFMDGSGMYTGRAMQNINTYRNINIEDMTELIVKNRVIYSLKGGKLKEYFRPEAALICCHGGAGENGCLQGLLELSGIPYTSTGVLESAFGMDKIVMKKLFAEMLLNIVRHTAISKESILSDTAGCIKEIESLIQYPFIVKPCSQGSSIGIERADDRAALEQALVTASYYDERVIVEEALTDMTELNCAAVLKEGKVITSAIERPVSWHSFLSFEDKYQSKGKSGAGVSRELPAQISDTKAHCIKGLTERIYKEMNLKGVVRMDFMMDNKTGKIYINEINTVPGSLSSYLFEASGIEFNELIDIMLLEAIRVKKLRDSAESVYPSGVLDGYSGIK